MLQNHKQSEVIMKGPKNAIPTLKGWAHEMTGEVLKIQKFTTDQIDEWYVANNRINRNKWFLEASEIDQQVEADVTQGKIEAAMIDQVQTDPNTLTKAALEEYGRELGVELDRRKTKANMIIDLEDYLKTL